MLARVRDATPIAFPSCRVEKAVFVVLGVDETVVLVVKRGVHPILAKAPRKIPNSGFSHFRRVPRPDSVLKIVFDF